MKIDILGTEWQVKLTTSKQDPRLEGCNGCCDPTTKELLIETEIEECNATVGDMSMEKARVIRHEIIHAYLYESGLHYNCKWATNEEAVDWIALQFPKLQETFAAVGEALRKEMK